MSDAMLFVVGAVLGAVLGLVVAFEVLGRERRRRESPPPRIHQTVIAPCALCLGLVEIPQSYIELAPFGEHYCCGACALAVEEDRVLYHKSDL